MNNRLRNYICNRNMDIFLEKFLPILPMAQKRFQGTGHRVFYSATTLKMCFPAAPPNKPEKALPQGTPRLNQNASLHIDTQ